MRETSEKHYFGKTHQCMGSSHSKCKIILTQRHSTWKHKLDEGGWLLLKCTKPMRFSVLYPGIWALMNLFFTETEEILKIVLSPMANLSWMK